MRRPDFSGEVKRSESGTATNLKRGVTAMERTQQGMGVGAVAACTAMAAHRRDHVHAVDACHPHAVEVIRLGDRALVVCHDCRTDTGYIAHREADHLAAEHRHDTVGTSCARLVGPDGEAAA